MERNLAIIPAKHYSRRFFGKNFRNFHGRRMFEYALMAAQESRLFESIYFSTDSAQAMRTAKRYGISNENLRPKKLTKDHVRLVDVIEYILTEYAAKNISFDNICLIYATAPMLEARDIRSAYKIFKKEKLDSLCGASRCTKSPLYAFYDHGNGRYTRLIDRLPSFDRNRFIFDSGAFYWFTVKSFRRYKHVYGRRHQFFMLPKWKSVDIDYPEDFELLNLYWDKYKPKKYTR